MTIEGATDVTEGVANATPKADDSSSSEVDGKTDKTAQPPAGKDEQEGEQLPFGKHPRWIKMVGRNRELETQLKGLEGAQALDAWIRDNPQEVFDWLGSKLGKNKKPDEKIAAPEEDDLADLPEPLVKRIKKYDDTFDKMEKERQEREEDSKREFVQRVKDNRANLDEAFDGYVEKAGFVEADEKVITIIAKATLAEMTEIARDPQLPTIKEMEKAFNTVVEGIKLAEKRGRARQGSQVDVPPTGSTRGVPPTGKTKRTEQDRINDIVNSM